MKTKTKIILSFLFAIAIGCSGGGSDDEIPGIVNLGSFEGSFLVTDDPQTDLGYIFNSTADFKKVGDKFTMKVSGDGGFNRMYEGTIDAEGASSTFIMSLERQTSPGDKIAGGTITLDNSTTSISILLASDAVIVKETVNDTIDFEIAGQLDISGRLIKRE